MVSILAFLAMAAPLCASETLQDQIQSAASGVSGRVGAAVMLVESGEIVAVSGGERFPMQSVYKLPIVMAVLERVDNGTKSLDQRVHIEKRDLPPAAIHSPIRDAHPEGGISLSLNELCRASIVESDGAASDLLVREIGIQAVARFLRGLGIDDLMVATTETEMASGQDVQYENWATPEAAVSLLRCLQEGHGLSPSSRRRLLRWMTSSTPGPRRIKGLLPDSTPVAHKTGSSGTGADGLARATNDVGLVTLPDGRHLAIAVFVTDSRADEAERESVIACIARAAWDCWSGRSD